MIFNDDKSVKVSGTVLPGLVKSIEIKDEALIDEQDVEGSSSKAKQAKGYDDPKVTIELILDDSSKQSKEKKLDIIQNLFRKSNQKKPIVHKIVNEHTAARNISKVIFKSFSTKDESTKQWIVATLEFWGYTAIKIKASEKKSSSKSSSTASSKLDPTYQSYLNNSRGSAPKTAYTPATDDDSTSKYSTKLSKLPY